MNENSNIPNGPNWEKLLAFLEQDVQDESVLNAEEQKQLMELKMIINETSEALSPYAQFDSKDKWNNVKERLEINYHSAEQLQDEEQITKPTKKLNSTLWPRIAAAAAIIIAVGAGLFYFNQRPTIAEQNHIVKNDIPPGHQGATLTLANGKKIKLADAVNGQLAKEAGVVITKSANDQLVYEIKETGTEPTNKINILSTAKGETYQVRLPDGTLVSLNAASSLEYPANFNSLKERRVKLTGEGYFEVAKDKAHPFVVTTSKQEVEVLGTHFNINSYRDEPVSKTTLLEGSVRVNDNTILKPGEQANVLPDAKVEVAIVDVTKVVAWKNGRFMFENESIESIMRKLARWYNVEVIFQDDVRDIPFTAFISRSDNISKILNKITYTQNIHFKIEGRRITVMR